ncbi:Ubiquitin fusion degradation protein 1 like protein [Dictyocoela muelleri]|nr:Ubiquitin fusion degradation protein 1 like protein [Dictyocoela muelleri]
MFFDLFLSNRPTKWSLYPSTFPKNDKNNYGGKVKLPDSLLYDLVQLQLPTPYIFEIKNKNYSTYCGVLDFTSQEGEIIVPEWLYNQLNFSSTSLITLKHVILPIGKSIKLLPHSIEFLEIDSVKRELEMQLRNYPVLTRGDDIVLVLENTKITFSVTETDPKDIGIYIVDVDLAVEFLPPIGYEEKLENEKSILKFIEIYDLEDGHKSVRMNKNGIYFCRDMNLK